jgi:hypothetical protein
VSGFNCLSLIEYADIPCKNVLISGKDESFGEVLASYRAMLLKPLSMLGYVMCGIQPQQLQLVKVRAQFVDHFFFISS